MEVPFSSLAKARLYSGENYNNVEEFKADEYRGSNHFSRAAYYPDSNNQLYLPQIHGLPREVRLAAVAAPSFLICLGRSQLPNFNYYIFSKGDRSLSRETWGGRGTESVATKQAGFQVN